ncbi:MAG: hypothetical protein KF789_05710 [Bdellovibrionaceae bacterium]|nr:hypothetical protein [Pseudobdellovibrionaceae bacterium]
MKYRFLFPWILLVISGLTLSACSKIDPEVRELLSALKPPVVPVTPSPPVVFEDSQFAQSLGGFATYELSSAGAAPGPYRVRLEMVSEVPVAAMKTPARQYMVMWDSVIGDELKDEGVLDSPAGFNP